MKFYNVLMKHKLIMSVFFYKKKKGTSDLFDYHIHCDSCAHCVRLRDHLLM